MTESNNNKPIAFVTGGSRGIGRAICIELAGMEFDIAFNYTSNDEEAEKTKKLLEELGAKVETMKFDVTNREDVDKNLLPWLKKSGKKLEVVVNNAGIRKDGLLVFMKPEEWHRVIDISLTGFFNITQSVMKTMLSNRKGRIVNVVSLSGIKGMPGQTNYSAAKAAMIGATKSLAQEIGKRGITVNAVAPGFIKTDMTEDLDEGLLKSLIPLNRFGTVEEVAKTVGFLASPGASYITGEVISINGGLYT